MKSCLQKLCLSGSVKHTLFNCLPNDKFLYWSRLKELADGKINANELLTLPLGRVENFMGKGENAGYRHFLLFLQCFQKISLPGLLEVWIVYQSINSLQHNADF